MWQGGKENAACFFFPRVKDKRWQSWTCRSAFISPARPSQHSVTQALINSRADEYGSQRRRWYSAALKCTTRVTCDIAPAPSFLTWHAALSRSGQNRVDTDKALLISANAVSRHVTIMTLLRAGDDCGLRGATRRPQRSRSMACASRGRAFLFSSSQWCCINSKDIWVQGERDIFN